MEDTISSNQMDSTSNQVGNQSKKPPCKKRRSSGKRVSTKTSDIWDHFSIIQNIDEARAACNYCSKDYACGSKNHGTNNMWNHLTHQCPEYPYGVAKMYEGGIIGSSKAFNLEESRKKLAKMIIVDELPFSIVEREGFIDFILSLEPRFVMPSRFTIARDCMKLYLEEKQNLKLALKSQRVCLTTDTWTSIQNLNYMCLTAHWIDDNWNLQKKILNFCLVPNHKGVAIGKTVETCLLDWGIDFILTLTVDNASSNDSAIKYLRNETKDWNGTILEHEFMHVRCSAHIVNLIMKDGLNDLNDSIARIRNAVRYVRSSPARLLTFKKCIEKAKIDSKSLLCLDVETRWNSTYKMLEAAEKFEKAFQRLELDDPSYLAHFDKDEEGECGDGSSNKGKGKGKRKWNKVIGPPKFSDWKDARCFIKFLKLFYNVTLKFSGSLFVTSNIFFHEIMALQTMLTLLCLNEDALLSNMTKNMKLKFDKYWDNIDNMNFLLYVAIVLDPRYKMKYVKFYLERNYGKEKARRIIERVESTLTRLYNHYYDCSSSFSVEGCNLSESCEVVNIDECEDGGKLLMSQFERHLQEEENVEKKSEIMKYFSDSFQARVEHFDILDWWKNNSIRFPVLSQVARHVLAIPISTVASESAFSTGGRILDPFRSSLSSLMVEALVCGQNWLRSSPISIDIKNKMDALEKYEEIETEFAGLGSPFVVEPTILTNEN